MKHSAYEPTPVAGMILEAIGFIKVTFGHPWGQVGEKKIIKIIKKRFKVEISRRTVTYWKKWLEDNGWLYWYQNNRKDDGGKWVYRTCKYYLKTKALNWLNSLKGWGEKLWKHYRAQVYVHNEEHKGRNLFVPWFLRRTLGLNPPFKEVASLH